VDAIVVAHVISIQDEMAGRLPSNGAKCDWSERAELARMSADLASDLLTFPELDDEAKLVTLFADGWRLDYRSPAVRELRRMLGNVDVKKPARGGLTKYECMQQH
jgi:hypothetical protein